MAKPEIIECFDACCGCGDCSSVVNTTIVSTSV